MTDHNSSGRMGLGLQNMVHDLCWALGQGFSGMFVPDCADVLARGRDALGGVNLAFLRIHFLLSLCPGGFQRITVDFSL